MSSSRWINTYEDIIALPHQAVCEDEYNGYRIPAGKFLYFLLLATSFLPCAGATITINTWLVPHSLLLSTSEI